MIPAARLLAPWWRRALAYLRPQRIVRRCGECGEPLATCRTACDEAALCRALNERAKVVRALNAATPERPFLWTREPTWVRDVPMPEQPDTRIG